MQTGEFGLLDFYPRKTGWLMRSGLGDGGVVWLVWVPVARLATAARLVSVPFGPRIPGGCPLFTGGAAVRLGHSMTTHELETTRGIQLYN